MIRVLRRVVRLGIACFTPWTIGCMGGQTGEVGSGGFGGECPVEFEVPLEIEKKFQGHYEADYANDTTEFVTCPGVDGQINFDISFADSSDELVEKPCGAAWYEVKVRLRSTENDLDQELQGYLSEDGVLELDQIDANQVTTLDPKTKTAAFQWHEPVMKSVPACCKETRSDEHPIERLNELGTISLEAQHSSEELGATSLKLSLAATMDDYSTCYQSELNAVGPVQLVLQDEDGDTLLRLDAVGGRWLDSEMFEITASQKVDSFDAPGLSDDVSARIFGVTVEVKLPFDDTTSHASVIVTLDLAPDETTDETNYEVRLIWKGELR